MNIHKQGPCSIFAPKVRRRGGFTLLVTLGLIVLVTGLVVAFFSRTTSALKISAAYRNHIEASSLAQLASGTIVEELQREVFAGSKSQKVGSQTIYEPAVAQSILPERVGSADTLPNLIKRSKRGEFLFSSGNEHPAFSSFVPRQEVSDQATDHPSLDGRSITAERWNYGLFLPRSEIGGVDRTPIEDFNVPDWIYTTDSGSYKKSFNPSREVSKGDRVIGRYAYCIYDQGGMLDVNVAGYPSNIDQKEAARKGSLGFASLVPIFKRAGISQGAAVQLSDRLVDWRNQASLSQGNPLTGYLDYLLTPGRSFLNVGGIAGKSDLAFISRQQLINYLLQELPGSQAERINSLQWLTTFTRDLPQPSFRPPDLGSPQRPKIRGTSGKLAVYSGGNLSAGKEEELNPRIPEIRVQNRFKRVSDGTMAKVGEPLLKWRFPLSRLEWITCDGCAATLGSGDPRYREAATEQAVLDSFGLIWDKAKKRWIYDHDGNGVGNNTKIFTLKEVAAIDREPDFMEILQAGIYAGSLGKSYSREGVRTYRYDEFVYSTLVTSGVIRANPNFEFKDAYTHLQILQIAAAMIDQVDTDSFPTEIVIRNPITNSFYLSVLGVERVPMLHRIYETAATRVVNAALVASDRISCFEIPELWDPHESTLSLPQEGLVPNGFRVSLMSKNSVGNFIYTGPSVNGVKPTYTLSNVSLFQRNNNNATLDSYDFNGPLGNTGYEAGFSFLEPTMAYRPASNGNPSWINPLTGSIEASGLNLLRINPIVELTPSGANPPLSSFVTNGFVKFTQISTTKGPFSGDPEDNYGITIQLECRDASGFWRKIGSIRNLGIHLDEFYSTVAAPNQVDAIMTVANPNISRTQSAFPIDPRSDRFPYIRNPHFSNRTAIPNPIVRGETLKPSFIPASLARSYDYNGNGLTIYPEGWFTNLFDNAGNQYYAFGLLTQNKSGSSTYYEDPDGVVRPGDAIYATTTDEDPICQTTGKNPARSIILNRPFRNVGELGYVFRGTPWKTIDFFTDKSADTALLDLFRITEPPTTGEGYVAGVVNLNTRNPEVLESLLLTNTQGAMMDESPGGSATYLSESDVQKMAQDWTKSTRETPITNLSEIVTRAVSLKMVPSGKDGNYKRRRESAVRALSGGATTRVWNLMVDLVAQTGELSPQAKSLGDFTVQGERRLWVHLSIDRLTGKILESKTEVVRE